ncbi:diguanylate cyclase [Dongshaea marina]|uniref:diguanylate cyclase n=1 Tax=Dongshaea marina TaxID=2047966 RepID=UPI000D3EA81E|nr:diguanylate cyclase [Dongshaea marina]
MKISQSITFVILAVLILVLGGVYLGARFLILNEFQQLERSSVERNLVRLHQAYFGRLKEMNIFTQDWSEWDDSYAYMQHRDPLYESSNLTASTLANLNIDIIAYLDLDGQLYTGVALEKGVLAPLSFKMSQELARYMSEQLVYHPQAGLWRLDDEIYLFSRKPILPSSGKGRAMGSLMMLKRVDAQFKSELQQSAAATASISRFNPEDFIGREPLLARLRRGENQVFIKQEYIHGMTLLRTYDKQPGLVIDIYQPREFYLLGRKMVYSFFFYLSIGGLIYALVVLVTLHGYVSSRLLRLSRNLKLVGDEEHSQQRVKVEGHDEIADVARSCNHMLDGLEIMRREKDAVEQRQRIQNEELVSLTTGDWISKGSLVNTTRRFNEALCRASGAARSSIWFCSKDKELMHCKDLYFAPEDEHRSGLSIPYRLVKERYQRRMSDFHQSSLIILEPLMDPRLQGMVRNLGLETLYGSVIISPIHHKGELLGFIVVEKERVTDRWYSDEQSFVLAVTDFASQIMMTLLKLETHQKLKLQASTDELTKLPNRSYFMELLSSQLQVAEEMEQPLALMFIDLDFFKAINDNEGHAAGDFVLQVVAQRLKSRLRRDDCAGRIGGDEFMVFICKSSASEAELIAKQLVSEIERPIIYEEKALSLSASIGISIYPQDADKVEQLIECADAAMYLVKKGGRQGVQLFTKDEEEES